MTKKPNISLVIPAKDEQDSIEALYKEVSSVLKNYDWELVFVDDGSKDKTFNVITQLAKKDKRVRGIKLRGWFGKSVALQVGFENARGDTIITMDADLQDNPIEIPKMIKKLNEGFDLVSGWKRKRHDPFAKTFPSKIGNILTRILTKVKIHDLNCGFKIYKRNVVDNLNLYGELYKYIPVLAQNMNFKVGEIEVDHRPRKFGKSKFGWERNIKGFLDMLTVVFLTTYLKRPAHFFGTAGIISFFFGFLIGVYITYLRFTTGSIQYRQPLLFLGILLMVIGVQLVTTGLLAEMITNFNSPKQNSKYFIDERI